MDWLGLRWFITRRAGATKHPLGHFMSLPLEVRVKILNDVIPESFVQVYQIVDRKLVYDRELSSPRPSTLQTSKQLRQEMFLTGALNGMCTITVDMSTIRADFLSDLVVPNDSTEQFPTFQISLCKLLNIFIAPPTSSNAWDILTTRRTVQQFARILSHAKFDHVEKISVELERPRGSGFKCPNVNYFELLVTPLLYLRKHGQSLTIVRPESCTQTVDFYCGEIEWAFQGDLEHLRFPTYEQLITDIKLPLCLWEDWFKQFPRTTYESAPVQLDYASTKEVFVACDRFFAVFAEDKGLWPEWLGRLCDIVRRQRAVPMNLLDLILGPEHHTVRRKFMLAYILGHDVASPFHYA